MKINIESNRFSNDYKIRSMAEVHLGFSYLYIRLDFNRVHGVSCTWLFTKFTWFGRLENFQLELPQITLQYDLYVKAQKQSESE